MTSEKSSTVDLLRHGAYVRFLYVRTAASIRLQVQAVAVGWLMYELTRSPFQLGLVGLVQFIPSIELFLATGQAADRYDRRTIVFIAQVFEALAARDCGVDVGGADRHCCRAGARRLAD